MTCPIPIEDYPQVLLAHGGGGKLMHRLIEEMFMAAYGSREFHKGHDSAVIPSPGSRLAFTTDSYVVRPLFFPGGDIGELAVNGTVNDLAMAGARPLYITVSFILEEGLAMETLWRVVASIQAAAKRAKVEVVTGDTKVVDRGKGDGIFINTAGIGVVEHSQTIAPESLQTGDVLLLSGDLARHGMAVMAVREGLEFESSIESDTAPLADLVGDLLAEGVNIHCMRDLTRGGLASALNEISQSAQKAIAIHEALVPVREDVASACEILGLDPFYVANEGRFIAFVPSQDKDKALSTMRRHPVGEGASFIGRVEGEGPALVTMTSRIGATRVLDMLSGEQLPRIC